MKELREEIIHLENLDIPIAMLGDADHNGDFYYIAIAKEIWLYTSNKVQADVLFEMLKDHIGEYVDYHKN